MNARPVVVIAVVALLVACSGSSSGVPGGGGGNGSSGGTSSSSGSSGDGTGSSGGTSSGGGSGGSSSGSTSSSGSSSGGSSGGTSSSGSSGGDAGFVCSGPKECSTSADVCCGTIPVTGGKVPNCTTGTVTVVCKAAAQCPTQLGGATCSGTQIVRLCEKPADCTETGAPKCCTFSEGSGSLSFCANGIVAAIGGGVCM